jgi:hypothetical protein
MPPEKLPEQTLAAVALDRGSDFPAYRDAQSRRRFAFRSEQGKYDETFGVKPAALGIARIELFAPGQPMDSGKN